MKRILQRLNIDCSHWKGQAWNKNEQLKDWSEYSKICHIKKHLIKKRGHCCENCGLDKWQNHEIPLEIDHKNGNRTDNHESNLLLLCCNCHALTPTLERQKKQTTRLIENPCNF